MTLSTAARMPRMKAYSMPSIKSAAVFIAAIKAASMTNPTR
jgi:hypothetical protein